MFKTYVQKITYFSTSNFGGACTANLCISFSETECSPDAVLALSANGFPYLEVSNSDITNKYI